MGPLMITSQKFTAKSASKRILKIGQYIMQL